MKKVQLIEEKCIDCGKCVKECTFLQKYGSPGELCKLYLGDESVNRDCLFQCNLCSLCSAVCPLELDCSEAFLEIRRDMQQRGEANFSQHKSISFYEQAGLSALLSSFIIPQGCDTVFFPGCAMAATRSDTTEKTYEYLQSINPTLGLVLHCCSKPSHDLGKEEKFHSQFGALLEKLQQEGVSSLITACPNCFVTLKKYAPQLNVRTVYEVLSQNPPHLNEKYPSVVTIHDACTIRGEEDVHQAVRKLVELCCANSFEMDHSESLTLCCGEGGAASLLAPDITKAWKGKRNEERKGGKVITYCAGCSSTFGDTVPNMHLLDLLFNTEKTIRNREQKSRSPFTYVQRLILKLKQQIVYNYL